MNGNGGAFGTFQERILGQAIQNIPFCLVSSRYTATHPIPNLYPQVSTPTRNRRLKDTPITVSRNSSTRDCKLRLYGFSVYVCRRCAAPHRQRTRQPVPGSLIVAILGGLEQHPRLVVGARRDVVLVQLESEVRPRAVVDVELGDEVEERKHL